VNRKGLQKKPVKKIDEAVQKTTDKAEEITDAVKDKAEDKKVNRVNHEKSES
jgi:hypothetical protein